MRRALVVEDEPAVRQELVDMLGSRSDVDVVGEADDLQSARRALAQLQPDLLFLDVQLPDGTGFDLFDGALSPEIDVVFVTAYEAFALRAFEVNALDYLLKPVHPQRLDRALERLRAPGAPDHSELQEQDQLFVRSRDSIVFLQVDSIVFIEADGDYGVVHRSDGRSLMIHKSLKDWEERLPRGSFARIHRSTLVNLRRLERIEPWFNRGYRMFLESRDEPVVVSRRYARRLRDRLL